MLPNSNGNLVPGEKFDLSVEAVPWSADPVARAPLTPAASRPFTLTARNAGMPRRPRRTAYTARLHRVRHQPKHVRVDFLRMRRSFRAVNLDATAAAFAGGQPLILLAPCRHGLICWHRFLF